MSGKEFIARKGLVSKANLEVEGTTVLTGSVTHIGDVKSSDSDGVKTFSGTGSWLFKDSLDKWNLHIDNITVRGRMWIYELLINQIRATNGSLWVSSSAKILSSDLITGNYGDVGNVVEFATDSEQYHGFMADDLIRAKRFEGGNLYQIDMKVTVVVDEHTFRATLLTSDAYITSLSSYIDLEFVRIGNTTNTNRQGAIYMTSDEEDSPFIDIVDGIDSHSKFLLRETVKTRLGKLTGIEDPIYGTLKSYGGYFNNIYATGNVNINGTLTAGDVHGAGSNFYVGNLKKNIIPYSNFEYWDGQVVIDNDDVRAEVGDFGYFDKGWKINIKRLDFNNGGNNWEWILDSINPIQEVILEKDKIYTLSLYAKSDTVMTSSFVTMVFNSNTVGGFAHGGYVTMDVTDVDDGVTNDSGNQDGLLLRFGETNKWKRYEFKLDTSRLISSTQKVYMSPIIYDNVHGSKVGTIYVSDIQIEEGEYATTYQKTSGILDNTISTQNNNYGLWAKQGGFGGTVQSPSLVLKDYGLFIKNEQSDVSQKVLNSTEHGRGIYIGNVEGDLSSTIQIRSMNDFSKSGIFGFDLEGYNIFKFGLDGDNRIGGWFIDKDSIRSKDSSLEVYKDNFQSLDNGQIQPSDIGFINYQGSGELEIIPSDDNSKKWLRIGNNSGDDAVRLIYDGDILIEDGKSYKFEIRLRRTHGIGVAYIGYAGSNGTNLVNGVGQDEYTGQFYVLQSDSTLSTTMAYYTYTLVEKPRADVTHFRPFLMCNYNGKSGITEVDYFKVTIIDENGNIELNSNEQKIILGNDTLTLSNGNGVFLSGSGEFAFNVDENNYLRSSADGLEIRSEKFNLTSGTTLKLDNINGGLFTLGGNTYEGANIALSGSGEGKLAGGNVSWDVDGNISMVGSFSLGDTSTVANTLYMGKMNANLFKHSQDFTNDEYWIRDGFSSVTISALNSPDNNSKWNLIVEDSSAGQHRFLVNDIPVVANTDYTFSIYVKNGIGTRKFYCGFSFGTGSDARIYVNLSNGSFTTSDARIIHAEVQDKGSGVYRVILTTNSSSESPLNFYMGMADVSETYTGNGTSSIYLWGAQLNIGDNVLTYQKTDGTLSTGDNYGLWASEGGFGGTTQNPRIALDEKGIVIRKSGGGSSVYGESDTISLGYDGAQWGILGKYSSTVVFQLGNVNKIGGWTFNGEKLSTSNIELGKINSSWPYVNYGLRLNTNNYFIWKEDQREDSDEHYPIFRIGDNTYYLEWGGEFATQKLTFKTEKTELDENGKLTTTDGEFNGIFSAGSGDSIFKADTSGIYLGNAVFASAPFSVTSGGVLKATSGTIGGWILGDTTITTGGNDTDRMVMDKTANTIEFQTSNPQTVFTMGKLGDDNYGIRLNKIKAGLSTTVFTVSSDEVSISSFNFDDEKIYKEIVDTEKYIALGTHSIPNISNTDVVANSLYNISRWSLSSTSPQNVSNLATMSDFSLTSTRTSQQNIAEQTLSWSTLHTNNRWVRVSFTYQIKGRVWGSSIVNACAYDLIVRLGGYSYVVSSDISRREDETVVNGTYDSGWIFNPSGASIEIDINLYAPKDVNGSDRTFTTSEVFTGYTISNISLQNSSTDTKVDLSTDGFRIYNQSGRNKMEFSPTTAELSVNSVSIGDFSFELLPAINASSKKRLVLKDNGGHILETWTSIS